MVFIHGGGFYSGSSTGYGPDFLIEHDVILVYIKEIESRGKTAEINYFT